MATRRCRRVPGAVSASAAAMADTSSGGSRSRRPIMDRRTSWARSGPASSRRNRANSAIRICTSSAGRAQLSEEKAKRLRVPIPSPGAASTTRRIASTPAWCPAERGSPRRTAHRPLPSMMTATWIELEVLCMSKSPRQKKWLRRSAPERVPRRADQRFHVGQVPRELAAAHRGEPVLGPRPPAVEALGTGDIVGFLELAGVNAQVAVARFEQRLQLIERERLDGGERAHHAEADAVMDEVVEARGASTPGGQRRLAPGRPAPPRPRPPPPGPAAPPPPPAADVPRSDQPPCFLPTIPPKATCSPPKPPIRSQLPHGSGSSKPTAPRTMKAVPMTGSTLTDHAPAATSPAP